MMKHTEVLKRAWKNLVSYRALWIFGIILALTTASGGRGWGGSTFYNVSGDEFEGRGIRFDMEPGDNFFKELGEAFEHEIGKTNQELERFFRHEMDTDIEIDIVRILTTLLWIGLAIFVIAKVLRYISETALIRMVDIREETGDQMGFGQGFRLGWSRTAWRLFLIDLTFGIPILVVFLAMFAVAVALMLPWFGGTGSAFLTVAAIGLFFLTILVGILVGVVLGMLKPFFRRASALDELGVFASIRQGYHVVRQNLKDVGLMWLIMLGLGLGWPIVIAPVAILLFVSGLALGILSGLMVGGLAGILWGAIVGSIVFLLVIIIPLAFLEGLREVFNSSTWTITYRELRALGSLDAGEVAEVEA
jgi:hypothetical protein